MRFELKYLLLFLAFSTSGIFLFAQKPDSTRNDNNVLDQVIEDAIIDSETDNQTDWTFMTDQLQDLQERPINLNTASKEELLLLPGMTEILANNLLNYIREFGNLTSIYELQAVPGFKADLFNVLKIYAVVKESGAKDISPGTKHPAGPSLKTMLSGAKQELILRFVTDIEQEKGYTDPIPGDTTRYLGDRNRYYMRYRMRYNRNLSIAVVGEKDQGEPIIWNPNYNYYGVDFTSAHIAIQDFGKLKSLVLGDYNLQVGQGMLLSRGLGFGKGSEAINSIKRQNLGITPYASVNENQFLRGAAATVATGDFYATGFFSHVGRDANISAKDSISDDVVFVSSLQTSGLHRTWNEIADKDAIKETAFGGRLEMKKRWLNLGATHYFQHFSSNIQPSVKDYSQFNFSGQDNYLSGLDFDFTLRNFNFFGDVGRSKSGGIGMIGGFLGSLTPKVEVAVLGRSFDRDFNAMRGYVFAERPTSVRNERGVYLGYKIMPNTRWTLSGFYDQFIFPWNNYQASFMTWGHEFMAQLQYQPSRGTSIYVRWRTDNKERNASILSPGQQIETIIPTHRQSFRIQFSHKIDRSFTVRTRFERSWYTQGFKDNFEQDDAGMLLYQDLVWKLNWKWDLTARYAIFDAENYNTRIYAYENDILGFFSIPAYSGIGSRYYVLLNYKPNKRLEFWARFSRTKYQYEKTLGSSLTFIDGDHRSDLKLQMKINF